MSHVETPPGLFLHRTNENHIHLPSSYIPLESLFVTTYIRDCCNYWNKELSKLCLPPIAIYQPRMTGSRSDDTVPHQIVVQTALSGPQTVDEIRCEPPGSLPLTSTESATRYANIRSGDQSQARLSSPPHYPQVLPLPRGHHDGLSSSGPGDVDTAPPTAAMSVASLDDEAKSIARMERENFLLFIKILFKVLEEDNDALVRSRAQRIVMDCRRRNQQGDPNYTPLMDGIERHLRVFVGEAKWRRSHLLLHHYISTRRGMSGSSSGNTNRQRPTAIMVGK